MREDSITIIIVITGLLISSTEFVAGGSFTWSTPLNRTCQTWRRSVSFHIVRLLSGKDKETRFGGHSSLFGCFRCWHNGNRTFMFFYPSIVIPHNILMVQAGKQCYFPLNPPKLLAGRVYADTFHSIIATIELISHLQNSNQSKVKCLQMSYQAEPEE